MSGVLGIIHFLEEFGTVFENLTVFQDNKSTIKLIENGYPDGKHSKHIHIRYFWLTDLVHNRRIKIVYCPTEDMVADTYLPNQPQVMHRCDCRIIFNIVIMS